MPSSTIFAAEVRTTLPTQMVSSQADVAPACLVQEFLPCRHIGDGVARSRLMSLIAVGAADGVVCL